MSVFGLTPFFNTPLNPLGADIFDALTTHTPRNIGRAAGDYNIERISDSAYRIAILATGLDEGDIDIEEKGGTLTIRATTPEAEANDYLHYGIGTRGFVRQFHLEEHVRVSDAHLDKGLLYINLTRDIPEAEKARKISLAKAVK